jgi:hypothetical protein
MKAQAQCDLHPSDGTEPALLREAASQHRKPPPAFGPVHN